MKAVWKGQVIAESDDIVTVEGNAYFPVESLSQKHFEKSDTHTTCPWKGKASYLSVVVDGEQNVDAAWTYPVASDAAKPIEGRVAFWKGVEIVD